MKRRSRFFVGGLLAALLPALAAAQTTISGRVTSEGGTPVPNAQVFLEGMSLGSQTDETGQYSFTVPAARASGQTVTLSARVIGYTSRSTPVTLTAGQLARDFVLAINPLHLEEVVVTGAGTTSIRGRLGNVINTVDSSLVRRSAEPQNVVNALAGKAPNVEVRSQGGDPGAGSSVKIRGAATILGTNQPLFVVDGMPINNDDISTDQTLTLNQPGGGGAVTQNRAADINPNDIESVDILKGSSAAAIYGARAANGVVLITTKRGHTGPTRYSMQSTSTFDNVIKTMPLQQKYGQGLDGVAFVCAAVGCAAGGLQNASWGPALAPGTPTYDHGKEIFDQGRTLDNNLSMSGGNERTTFYLSGGLTSQDGVIVGPNNKYNRASLRLKGTHQLSSQLNVGGNFSYVDARGRYVQKGSNTSGLLLGSLRTPPEFNNQVYLDPANGLHRSYRYPRPALGSETRTRSYDNPFFTLNNQGNKSELGRFIGNVNLDYNPLSWLAVKYTLGGDSYSDWRLEGLPQSSSGFPTGRVVRLDINNLEIDHNLIATATKSWTPRIGTTLTLGQNLNSRRQRQTTVLGTTLIAPEPMAVQNTVSWLPFETRTLQHVESYFAQGTADLYEQLFLTLGIRNDGFSTFGASKRRHNFPKASLAWIFTNALGKSDQSGLLSFGKVRLAYGETGREPTVYGTVNAFQEQVLFGSGYGDLINTSQSSQPGVTTDVIQGNSNLRPERSRENEYGLDFGFLDQRVDLSLTHYNKRSTDVILRQPTSAAATGYLRKFANAAVVTNKGEELVLNVRPFIGPAFSWELSANYGRNRNNVVSLAGAEFVAFTNEGFTGAIGSATAGAGVGVVRGLDFIRCGRGLHIDYDGDGSVNDIDAECRLSPLTPGTFAQNALFLTDDGRPVADPTDRVIANPNPKYSMGFGTTAKLGKATFGALADVRKGVSVWNGTRGILLRFGTLGETLVRERTGTFGKDWATDVYPDVAGPGAGTVAFANANEWQDWFLSEGGGFGTTGAQFVEDASFVKLRELSLSYSFDQQWIRDRLNFSTIDIRIAGRNLKTWTKYKGLDPEANLGGAEWLTQGTDYFNNPQTRSFVLSFSLNR
ncbi:MAG: SusC/RagA family TonB-linked outer membrane protein [Gemmatimonadaceae bacterium]